MGGKKIGLEDIPEPTWLKEVAPNSCMNLKDLADIFKLKLATMRGKVTRGEFPEPDIKHLVGKTFGNKDTFCNKGLWKVSTIRKFFKQKKESNEKENNS
jgi:hypothetical protein